MIQAKFLDPILKVEAISSSNHILNRSPHNALDGKNPFEAWCDRKPVVRHFRVFGCLTWANISSRGCKVPPHRPFNFIRYENGVKAYRLMDPKTHEIFIERNSHFEESSPSLSSNHLHDSHIVETDTDNSDSDSKGSLLGDPFEKCKTR